MSRDESEDVDDGFVHVAFRRDGAYTVSFTEDDLQVLGSAIAIGDESVSNDVAESAIEPADEAGNVTTTEGDSADAPMEGRDAPKAFGDLTSDDVRVECGSLTMDIGDFHNDGTTITLGYTDKDAAANATDSYEVVVDALGATMPVVVDFEDHELTCDPEAVPMDSNGLELTLSVAEGSFASNVAADKVTLGECLEDMAVESISANGGYLTLTLSGNPKAYPDEEHDTLVGVVSVAAEGFENGYEDENAYVSVYIEDAPVDVDVAADAEEEAAVESENGTPAEEEAAVESENGTPAEEEAVAEPQDDAPASDAALVDADPKLTAYIERAADGSSFELADDGSATIKLNVRMASTNGDVDLTNSTLDFQDDGINVLDKTVSPDAPHQAELVVEQLTKGEVRKLKKELAISNTAEALDARACQDAHRMAMGLSVAGGVMDAAGDELPASAPVYATAYNLVSVSGSSDVLVQAESDKSADAVSLLGDSEEDRAKAAHEALKYSAEVIKIIGSFASTVATENPGGAITGVGQILGLIDSAIAPTGWTINDVMNAVLTLDSKMDSVAAQIGDITYQLDKLGKDVDYKTQVGNLTTLCNQAAAYRPWVTRALTATQNASDRDTFKLDGGSGDSATGKALQDLCTQTTKQSSLTAGNKSTYQVASELADAIIGDSATQQTGGVRSFFNYSASCVNWEPEAYYMRSVFVSNVSGSFYYAYVAARNELNHQMVAAKSDVEREVCKKNLETLAKKADSVAKLLDDGGTIMASTRSRTDGNVLCTVNNKLYPTATEGSYDHPALNIVFENAGCDDYDHTFGDLLSSRDEDKDHAYTNQSTMTRSDFDTMASREAFVRTVPGYSGATSISREFDLVDLMPKGGTDLTPFYGDNHSKCHVTFHRDNRLRYALVGNPQQTQRSDAASNYHKRTYGADMYDIENNQSVGRQTLYYYNVDYKAWECRWHVYLDIYNCFEMRAS